MGKSIVTPNHVYTKLGNGTIRDLTLDTNTDTVYTHPSYKVCNYSVDTSQFATKTDLNNISGKLIGTKSFYISLTLGAPRLCTETLSIDFAYDYVEMTLDPFDTDSGVATLTTKILKGHTGSIVIQYTGNGEKTADPRDCAASASELSVEIMRSNKGSYEASYTCNFYSFI